MPKEEIVEGLRYALSKGDNLEKAMMSFFNSGYSKEDIEEAANFLNAPRLTSSAQQASASTPLQGAQQPSQPQTVQPSYQTQTTQQTPQSQTQTVQTTQKPQPKVVQRVSEYVSKPGSFGKIITIILMSLLVLLLGVLVAVFLFRDELSEFLNALL